jgi:hypothetical protein
MDEEIWTPIPDYPDYHISNHGRVKSIGRWIEKSTGATVWFPTKILAPVFRGEYLAVNIYANKTRKMHNIHILVARIYVHNPDPSTKTQVNHLDVDKLNNHHKNLQWTTPKENTQHAIAMGVFRKQRCGEENTNSKLTNDDVKFIRNTRFYGAREYLSKKLGVTVKHIDRIRSGERWGHSKSSK